MDMTISIPDEVALKLKELAAMSGQSVPAYTARLVAETVNKPDIDKLLAPVREDFARSGLTENELMELGRRALTAVRQEKKAKSA
ncbi:MAG TPA: hypothetical protein VH370_21420 [Humisphaera sp.]|jgi:hypothetical protein|nr:hypothetical protein [Humisphaera sp.]